MKRKATSSLKKHAIIIPKTPEYMQGYPYPKCITGGWTALLNAEQTSIVDARVAEMQAIDKVHYADYTGFDALNDETQVSIRKMLDENKEWEKKFGAYLCTRSRIK